MPKDVEIRTVSSPAKLFSTDTLILQLHNTSASVSPSTVVIAYHAISQIRYKLAPNLL